MVYLEKWGGENITKGKTIKEPKSSRFKERLKKHEGLLICRNCQAVYINKAWRHLKDNQNKKNIKKAICPACLMRKNKNFEGEITIEFKTDISNSLKEELKNLINNISHTAYQFNPLSRIGEFKETKNKWNIYFTDNQLAKRIATKIKNNFLKKITQSEKNPYLNASLKITNLQDKISKTKIFLIFYEGK
ncbi:MAG: NMD3-related protein [Minisyncoccia bacterium]